MEEWLKQMGSASGELWKVFKNFAQNAEPSNQSWWDSFAAAMEEASRKYFGTEVEIYVRDYALALMVEMERKTTGRQIKPRERKGNTNE